MTRSNDFALAYNAAHEEAGLTRVNVTQVMHRIAADPGYLLGEEFGQLAGQCPVHHGTRPEDYDKVVVNTTLTVLYEDLRTHVLNGLPLTADGGLALLTPPESPHGLDPNDHEALAAVSAETLCSFLRDCSCTLLDALIRAWAVKVMAEEERCRAEGEITPMAAASFALDQRLSTSELYVPSGYNLLSITKTGSHTALHVCWNLLEASVMLAPGKSAAEYTELIRRSLKHVVPLSMGSLGMLVQYMEATGIEAEDHQAIHVLPFTQTAFLYDNTEDGGVIRLNPDFIKPTAKEGEHYYTGCPGFYATNMIKMYMEIALMIAVDYGVFDRLQERRPA